jgi:hypothetical protein
MNRGPNWSRLGPRRGLTPARPGKLICFNPQLVFRRNRIIGLVLYIVYHNNVSNIICRFQPTSRIGNCSNQLNILAAVLVNLLIHVLIPSRLNTRIGKVELCKVLPS